MADPNVKPTVFDPLKADAARFAETTKDLGKNAQTAFKTTFDASKGAATGFGGMLLYPVRLVVKIARWPVALVNVAFKSAPRISTVATVGAGLIAVTSFLRGRAEKRTQEEATAQAMAVEPSVSYKNSVSADEAALLEGRMSAGKAHADTVTAARQQVPTPENAAGL